MLQGVDVAGVHVDHGVRECEGLAYGLGLLVVVAQDEVPDLVGHAGEQLVALLLCHVAALVDGVHVDLTVTERVLYAPPLREPEVPALPDHAAPELVAVCPEGVVRPVADFGIALRAGLDVGPYATVPQQIDLGFEHSVYKLCRRHGLCLDVEHLTHLGRERDGLGRAREDAAALGDEALVVVSPRGAGEPEEALALLEALLGIGVGIEEDVHVVEGAHELYVTAQEHAVAEHVTRHVPDTNDGKVLGLDVLAEFAEVTANRLPGSPRRYTHLLVVVADGAAGGEGVAEPEAVLGREFVSYVREGRRALVCCDDEVGVVIVVARDVGRYDLLVG